MSLPKELVRAVKRSVVPKGRAFRRILFGPAAGRWMNLDLTNELRMYLGVFERELWKPYRALLKRGMKSFDIGGRDGYSALVVGSCTLDRVISFECDASAIPNMHEVFRRNTLPISAYEAFIGSAQTTNTTLTLDRAAEQFFIPDFIKIDVEGAEADVLSGGLNLFRDSHPSLIVEVHGVQAEQDCLKILGASGYETRIVNQSRFWPDQRTLSHNRWLVCRPKT